MMTMVTVMAAAITTYIIRRVCIERLFAVFAAEIIGGSIKYTTGCISNVFDFVSHYRADVLIFHGILHVWFILVYSTMSLPRSMPIAH